MRNPWFPIALMLIVLLGVWLGILVPLPGEVAAWISKWQTLIAATVASCVASIAAYIAFQNTTRSLNHAEELEKRRRNRKHAALRAVLPLALAQVQDYAERSAHALTRLISECDGETLPAKTAPESIVQPLPSETLATLADFIEYSDTVDVGVIEATVAWIQIHHSRIRGLVEDNRDPSSTRIVLQTEIDGNIVDAASIYAGAAAVYEYARRQRSQIPPTLSWDAVRSALRNMRLWEDEFPRLWDALKRREGLSAGPFERLKVEALLDAPE
jgi:hypothetical protein